MRMKMIFNKVVIQISAATTIVLSGAGCAWNQANYNRETKWVVPPLENHAIPCYGSIDLWHHHGMMHFSPEGPWWHTDLYSIYFKQATNSPTDFYLRLSRDRVPVEIKESKGVVTIEGHSVLIDVEYRDATGHWIRPPINGRRKLRFIFPDDIRRSTNAPPAP